MRCGCEISSRYFLRKMVVACCAFACTNKHVTGGPISFHCFPRDEHKRKLWEKNVRREGFKATHSSRICSEHFNADCFDRAKLGGRWLKKDAVPTVFDFSAHIKKNQAERQYKKRKVFCGTPNEPGINNTSNEHDTSSSDRVNKEDTGNSHSYDRLKKEAAASLYPTDESSAGPSSGAPQCVIKESKGMKQQVEAPSLPKPTDKSSAGPSNTRPRYKMKDKKFVNVAFFVKSLQNLNNHGGDGCNFSDMHISGETNRGWKEGIELSCTVCLTTVVVWTDDPGEKLLNLQPPTHFSAGTTTKRRPLIAEKVPAKKLKNYQKAPVLPVQKQFMVPPPLASRLLVPQTITPRQVIHPLKVHSIYPQSPVPPQLARPLFVPQSIAPRQDWTYNKSHSINLHSNNQATFVKQEIVSPEDAANACINQVPTSTTQPAAVQLLFCVEPSQNSISVNESATLTPAGAFGNCQTSSMVGLGSDQTLVTSENELIVPEITSGKVLPVDLNLVKEEIEDGSQSMEVPSVCVAPMSETSLNRLETSFASKSSTKTEIQKDSSPVRYLMSSTKTYSRESRAKMFASVSDTSGAKSSTLSFNPSFVIPQKDFQQVISGSKDDFLSQTPDGKSDNNLPNLGNKINSNT